MKYLTIAGLLLATCFLGSTMLSAQTKAVTEHGDTIYVYDNGTWAFEMLDEMPEINEFSILDEKVDVVVIDEKFKKPADSKKQVKNENGQFVIHYNDKFWKRIPPASLNEDAEFAFQSKKSDIWCLIISEETQIEADKLFLIAKSNMADTVGEEPEIVALEQRTVNGTELIRGVMDAGVTGMQLTFDSYYFSNELGSVQFVIYSGTSVWEKYKKEIHNLLNGFEVK